MGLKTIIKCVDVKLIDVPQFEGLTIQDIYTFAHESNEVKRALPPAKEILKLSRAYLANVIFTIIGSQFKDWVDQQVKRRNAKIAAEGNNMITLDP